MSNLTKILMLLGIGLFLAAASVWFIGGKKKDYDVTMTVNARPTQVFPFLVEPDLKKKWQTQLIDERVIDSPDSENNKDVAKFGEGTLLATVMEIGGQSNDFDSTIIRFQQDEILSIKSRNDNMHLTSFFRLKGKGQETEIECRRIVQHAGFTRFTSVFAEDRGQDELRDEISRLVSVIESEAQESGYPVDEDVDTSDDAGASNEDDAGTSNEDDEAATGQTPNKP